MSKELGIFIRSIVGTYSKGRSEKKKVYLSPSEIAKKSAVAASDSELHNVEM